MKITKKQRIGSLAESGQMWWDLMLILLVIFAILSGITYFFVYKMKQTPDIQFKKDFAPSERGVLPKGTFFPNK
ncbi:MAG: hypothetical protein AAB371_01770 [Patescibacteria group bacterium]